VYHQILYTSFLQSADAIVSDLYPMIEVKLGRDWTRPRLYVAWISWISDAWSSYWYCIQRCLRLAAYSILHSRLNIISNCCLDGCEFIHTFRRTFCRCRSGLYRTQEGRQPSEWLLQSEDSFAHLLTRHYFGGHKGNISHIYWQDLEPQEATLYYLPLAVFVEMGTT
jgi:hypothetical protein